MDFVEWRIASEPTMDTRNFTFLFYGFAAAWLMLVIYVITLVARERRIHREMSRLKNMLESGERRSE